VWASMILLRPILGIAWFHSEIPPTTSQSDRGKTRNLDGSVHLKCRSSRTELIGLCDRRLDGRNMKASFDESSPG
jgi:hypothetical protein